MLAEQRHRRARARRAPIRDALDGISARRRPAGGLRRQLRGPVLLRRAADRRRVRRRGRRPAAHRALAQRHRHDDVPHAAARDGAGRAGRRRCGCARCCSSSQAAHRDDVFAAHTHTQPAQPTHDRALPARGRRAARARRRRGCAPPSRSTNRNPLGACAITGTGFPIDRDADERAARLRRRRPGNTYGSIATVDYLLESVSADRGAARRAGPRRSGLLLWCTSEFGYLRLADEFVQCSSIMPQKRNPVALEHARAIGSKAVGQAGAILLTVHNTPFGDIVDTEDDLQPLVFVDVQRRDRAVRLVAAAMATRDVRPRAGSPSARSRAGSPSPSWPTRWRAITACRSRPATRSRPGWSPKRTPTVRSRVRGSCATCRWRCWAAPIEYDEPRWPRS